MSMLFSMLRQLSIVFYARVYDVCGFPSILVGVDFSLFFQIEAAYFCILDVQ